MSHGKRVGVFSVCRAVGWVSFLEILRDKILYNIVVLAFLLLGVGFLASRLTFGRADRIILDFGLLAVNVSCALIAIFVGASVLGREFERRTIFVALSRPISKPQFLLGKFTGVALIVAVNWFLLSAVYLAILGYVSSSNIHFTGNFSATLFLALFFLLLQSWVMASLALMFSTFSTTSLSAVFALGLYLVGNNVVEIRMLAVKMKDTPFALALNGVAGILPNLEHFNLGTKVTYGMDPGMDFVTHTVLYGIAFTMMVLAIAGLLVRKRES